MSDRISDPSAFRLGYFALPEEDVDELRQWIESAPSALSMRVKLVRKGPFSAIATDIGSMLVPQRVAQLNKIGCPVLLIAEHDPTGVVQASVRSSMPQAVVLARPLRADVLTVCLNALVPLTRAAPEVLLACLSALAPLIRSVSEKGLLQTSAAPLRAKAGAADTPTAGRPLPPLLDAAERLLQAQDDDLRTTLMGRLPELLAVLSDLGALPEPMELPKPASIENAAGRAESHAPEPAEQPLPLLLPTLRLDDELVLAPEPEPEPEPEFEASDMSEQTRFSSESVFDSLLESEIAELEELITAPIAAEPTDLAAWTWNTAASEEAEPPVSPSLPEPVIDAVEPIQIPAAVVAEIEVLSAHIPVQPSDVPLAEAPSEVSASVPATPRHSDTNAARRYQRLVQAMADWKNAGVKVDTMARYSLKGWPTPEWLEEDALRVRIASLLAQKPLMLNEVASATGASWIQCQACLSGLLAAGLLQRQSKNAAASTRSRPDASARP